MTISSRGLSTEQAEYPDDRGVQQRQGILSRRCVDTGHTTSSRMLVTVGRRLPCPSVLRRTGECSHDEDSEGAHLLDTPRDLTPVSKTQ